VTIITAEKPPKTDPAANQQQPNKTFGAVFCSNGLVHHGPTVESRLTENERDNIRIYACSIHLPSSHLPSSTLA
jgi:hypothetical protein